MIKTQEFKSRTDERFYKDIRYYFKGDLYLGSRSPLDELTKCCTYAGVNNPGFRSSLLEVN